MPFWFWRPRQDPEGALRSGPWHQPRRGLHPTWTAAPDLRHRVAGVFRVAGLAASHPLLQRLIHASGLSAEADSQHRCQNKQEVGGKACGGREQRAEVPHCPQ